MKSLSIAIVSLIIIIAVSLVYSDDITSSDNKDKIFHKYPKKYLLNDSIPKHQDTKELAKKLEYYVNSKNGAVDAAEFGLVPLDLNLLPDDEVARDVVEGVEDEFVAIDQEFGDFGIPPTENGTETGKKDIPVISLMFQGMYEPSPDFNSLVDGLVFNVKLDINRRDLDPLYFGIHSRGRVRHSSKKITFHPSNLTESASTSPDVAGQKNVNKSSAPLGIGVIRGLRKLTRVGHTESRKDGDITWIRSHYFFGPLNIQLIFAKINGLHVLKSDLNSLAGHALLKISDSNNSTTLEEFIIDSPMDYEIRLRGKKESRFTSISKKSISRLFKRGGRMETRLRRSFDRGSKKPIRDVTKENEGIGRKRNNRGNGRKVKK